jgi:mannose/fructose/N-acetylgalactosamine-specific phosphotransferase system component IIC
MQPASSLSNGGRAQKTGVVIMALACVEMLLFVYGALRRSYLALAIPVAVAMTALTALGFWVGYTMMTMEDEPEEPHITLSEP